MKLNNIRLIDLIPLREAEEEAEENPFGAADDKGGEEGAAEEPAEDDKKEAKPKAEAPPMIAVEFNRAAVKRYNNQKFLGNQGELVSINKDGAIVKMPNEVEIIVNLNDIE
jgi:hypothetical protein